MAKKEIAAEKKENTKKEKKQPDITIEEAVSYTHLTLPTTSRV